LVVSFLVVSFFVVSVDDFLVVDFFVVDVLAGDFSGIVVVLVSFLLVQAPMRPAANRTVNE
jgi:predicted HAD superfamily phosphohydrolase YqeG